jgi:hypothetical protein
MTNPLTYYAQPGPLTTLTDPAIDSTITAALLDGLPDDVASVVKAVRGNVLHPFTAEPVYGIKLSDERLAETNIRTAAEMLRRIHTADPAPLTVERPPEKRLIGTCRDFTVLTCGLLRYKGIPVRARCGFASYLPVRNTNLKYIDHWVSEHWTAGENRWIQVDEEMDEGSVQFLKLDFDPLDVPHDRFLSAGRAWQRCREGQEDPDTFGILSMHGWDYVLANLVRDFAALSKVELLPWDSWGAILQERTGELFAFLDHVADLALADNSHFDEVRALYAAADRLRVPPVITTYPTPEDHGPVQLTLADEPGFVPDR